MVSQTNTSVDCWRRLPFFFAKSMRDALDLGWIDVSVLGIVSVLTQWFHCVMNWFCIHMKCCLLRSTLSINFIITYSTPFQGNCVEFYLIIFLFSSILTECVISLVDCSKTAKWPVSSPMRTTSLRKIRAQVYVFPHIYMYIPT